MTDIKELDDDCACGGGAISGHATGCPEAARFASPPSPAPAESGAVANAYADLLQRQTDTDPDIAAIVGQNRSKLYMAPAPSASMGRVTEEVIDALISACNQIEYLHGKFEETGSGNAMIASLTDLRRRLQAAALDSPPDHGGGEGDAGKKVADRCHPSHVTRISMDASSYDEICVKCGATDHIGGWGKLAKPCPCALSEPDKE